MMDYKDIIPRYALDWICGRVEEEAKAIGSPLRILDMGCGTGFAVATLASKGHKVVGVDLDPESINFCIKNWQNPNANFICADCLADDFPEKVSTGFNVVIANNVLEHVEDPHKFLLNAMQCATPDCLYLILVPNGYNMPDMVSEMLEKMRLLPMLRRARRAVMGETTLEYKARTGTLKSEGRGAYHIQHYTLKSLRKLFSEIGFETVEEKPTGTFLWLGHFFYFRSNLLQALDLKLGRLLPSAWAGGWMFALRHKPATGL